MYILPRLRKTLGLIPTDPVVHSSDVGVSLPDERVSQGLYIHLENPVLTCQIQKQSDQRGYPTCATTLETHAKHSLIQETRLTKSNHKHSTDIGANLRGFDQ